MLAPDSLVSAMGTDLAVQEVKASEMPLQTTLGGVSVQVVDSTGYGPAGGFVLRISQADQLCGSDGHGPGYGDGEHSE